MAVLSLRLLLLLLHLSAGIVWRETEMCENNFKYQWNRFNIDRAVKSDSEFIADT